eukprot:4370776-Pyramimonas_sp.AAC.1
MVSGTRISCILACPMAPQEFRLRDSGTPGRFSVPPLARSATISCRETDSRTVTVETGSCIWHREVQT